MHTVNVVISDQKRLTESKTETFDTIQKCVDYIELMAHNTLTDGVYIDDDEIRLDGDGKCIEDDGRGLPMLSADGVTEFMGTLQAKRAVAAGTHRYLPIGGSAAYQTAELINRALKLCIGDLMWISGNEREMTSYGVGIRWERLKALFKAIREPWDVFQPHTSSRLVKLLQDEISSADRANVLYNPEDDGDPQDYFDCYLSEYADVLFTVLRTVMGKAESEYFDDNK